MKDKYRALAAQATSHTALKQVANALKSPSLIGASICFSQTNTGYHGHYIHWYDDRPRLLNGSPDYARLLLRLEELGLPTSKSDLEIALWLMPSVPEGVNPIGFLNAQGDAA